MLNLSHVDFDGHVVPYPSNLRSRVCLFDCQMDIVFLGLVAEDRDRSRQIAVQCRIYNDARFLAPLAGQTDRIVETFVVTATTVSRAR